MEFELSESHICGPLKKCAWIYLPFQSNKNLICPDEWCKGTGSRPTLNWIQRHCRAKDQRVHALYLFAHSYKKYEIFNA